MTEEEWTSGMMVADEQILAHIEEIEQTIASAKDNIQFTGLTAISVPFASLP